MPAPTPPRIPAPHPLRAEQFTRPALHTQAPASGSGQVAYYRPGPGITEPAAGTVNGIATGLASRQRFQDTRDDATPTPIGADTMRALTTPTPTVEAPTRGTP